LKLRTKTRFKLHYNSRHSTCQRTSKKSAENGQLPSEALKALANRGGYEQEIGVIEVVSKLQSRFATGVLGGESQATSNAAEFIESGRIIFDLVKLISSKYGDSPRMGFPQSSWMGKLFRSMPTSPIEVASLVAGFKSISAKIVEIQQLAPNHQVLNYVAGQAYFGEGKFRKGYELLRLASQSDAIIDGLTSRACWWAFGSFLTDTVLSKSQLNETELVELLQLVIDRKRNDGKFITTPFPEDLAWCMLIRARVYGLAIELAQQELAIESKPSKFNWQDRLDATLELKKKNDELTEAVLERLKPKS